MKKIIYNLRKQPEHVRTHILNIVIVAAAVILILLWIYSLSSNLNNPDTQAKISQDFRPLSALKENMVNGYQSITNPQTNTLPGAQQ